MTNVKEKFLSIISDCCVRWVRCWIGIFVVFWAASIQSIEPILLTGIFACFLSYLATNTRRNLKLDAEFHCKRLCKFHLIRARRICFVAVVVFLFITSIMALGNVLTGSYANEDFWWLFNYHFQNYATGVFFVCAIFCVWAFFAMPVRATLMVEDPILALEWYPTKSLFTKGKTGITLHLLNPTRAIRFKNKQMTVEARQIMEYLVNSGISKVTINSHVISERQWNVMKLQLDGIEHVKRVKVEQSKKGFFDYWLYRFSMYVMIVLIKQKQYSDYRTIIDSQLLDNNRKATISFV